LEVKGSKNQIGLDEFSSFVPKILADFQAQGCQSKGIFVGNGLCERRPQERLGAAVFSPHVVEAAKTSSVALVSSVELYSLICNVLSGEVTDFEPIRAKILATNGFTDL